MVLPINDLYESPLAQVTYPMMDAVILLPWIMLDQCNVSAMYRITMPRCGLFVWLQLYMLSLSVLRIYMLLSFAELSV